MLAKAMEFAAAAHKDGLRKGSNTPYIMHPMEAAVIVSQMTDDQELMAAALLHDTIEDTTVTYEELLKEFGQRIADLVATESEDKSKTWQERKAATLRRMAQMSREEKILALGDKLSNLRSLYRDYRTHGEALWQRFHETDPQKQAWYYRNLGKKLSSLNGFPEYDEFIDLIEKVFGVYA